MQTLIEMLEDGFNPYKKTINQLHASKRLFFETNDKTVAEAFYKAIEDKKNTWAASTAESVIFRVEKFILFAEKHEFINEAATSLKRVHDVEFLNTIKARETATSVNNYRSAISSVY